MAGIVAFPQVVEEALDHFGDLLPNEPQRRHFAEYLTGLFVAERKNVSGINREFAQTTDQSCLNRFLTDADWDVQEINQRRLHLLQGDLKAAWEAAERPSLFSPDGRAASRLPARAVRSAQGRCAEYSDPGVRGCDS